MDILCIIVTDINFVFHFHYKVKHKCPHQADAIDLKCFLDLDYFLHSIYN